eukprot:241062-Rhodomonas_salina.1
MLCKRAGACGKRRGGEEARASEREDEREEEWKGFFQTLNPSTPGLNGRVRVAEEGACARYPPLSTYLHAWNKRSGTGTVCRGTDSASLAAGGWY